MKLKTLKDIKSFIDFETREKTGIYSQGDLKAEAKKWVKEFEKALKEYNDGELKTIEYCLTHNKFINEKENYKNDEEEQTEWKETEKHIFCETLKENYDLCDITASISLLKHFFNLDGEEE